MRCARRAKRKRRDLQTVEQRPPDIRFDEGGFQSVAGEGDALRRAETILGGEAVFAGKVGMEEGRVVGAKAGLHASLDQPLQGMGGDVGVKAEG